MSMAELTPLQAGIYEILRRAAHCGNVCPGNASIADELSAQTSSVHSACNSLMRKGLIQIEYGMARKNLERIITAIGDSVSTATPEGFVSKRDKLAKSNMSQSSTPCFRCGSRMDACQCGGRS